MDKHVQTGLTGRLGVPQQSLPQSARSHRGSNRAHEGPMGAVARRERCGASRVDGCRLASTTNRRRYCPMKKVHPASVATAIIAYRSKAAAPTNTSAPLHTAPRASSGAT